ATTKQIDAETLRKVKDRHFVLDVRGRSEFEEGHIDGAHNVHVGHIRKRAGEIPKDQSIVVHCLGGYRSVIASSVLEQLGYTDITNLMGGYAAWERVEGKAQGT
ncbi:MAG: rhodanese-like domain-containing protein, partial [Spirochaetaceae bacterium]